MSDFKSWAKKHPIWILLIVSVLIHLVIISAINWDLIVSEPKEKLFEVDLAKKESRKSIKRAKSAKPNAIAKKQSSQAKKPKAPKVAVPKPTFEIQSKISPETNRVPQEQIRVSDKQIQRQKPSLRPTEVLRSSNKLPPVDPRPEPVRLDPRTSKAPSSSARISSSQIKPAEVSAEVEPGIIGKTGDSTGRGTENKEGSGAAAQGQGEGTSGKNTYIEGEVGKRKVVFKPAPPVLNIEKDVTVSLRFTVLPNGEVDQIFPHIKTDPELELLGINLLRKYRFEPLFGSDVVQSGIIHFTLKRRP